MTFNLAEQNTIANQYVSELRNVQVQGDRMRFRRNLERLGEIMAYELSKTLDYAQQEVETPLGTASTRVPSNEIVIGTILRAGLPLHQGFLNYFDQADNAFISAYRKHHKDGTFEINLEYISCPDLNGKVLIMCDPMLATGSSMVIATRELLNYGQPASLHIATAIAARQGLDYVQRHFAKASYWVGALDDELTAKSYIVPGLGDAGDLSYGEKIQD